LDSGYGIVTLPGAHVWHEKTPVARVIPEQHRSGVCNDLVVALRRTPVALLPAALLVKLYRHLTFSWNHDLIWPCLQGFAWFARLLPTVWLSRRPIRAETLRAYMRLAKS
jgi:GT2 family glycosyltransferase